MCREGQLVSSLTCLLLRHIVSAFPIPSENGSASCTSLQAALVLVPADCVSREAPLPFRFALEDVATSWSRLCFVSPHLCFEACLDVSSRSCQGCALSSILLYCVEHKRSFLYACAEVCDDLQTSQRKVYHSMLLPLAVCTAENLLL